MAQHAQDSSIIDAVEPLEGNGFKAKTVKTRLGALPLRVPQTRDSEFYAQSVEKGLRSERALLLSIAEMYVQGVSTRRVKRIVEELCGMDVSSTQVSRAAAELDELMSAWRERELGQYRYLVLDAQYEKVRQGGKSDGGSNICRAAASGLHCSHAPSGRTTEQAPCASFGPAPRDSVWLASSRPGKARQ